MALVRCPECSHEISDQATTCPHCGRKRPRNRTPLVLAVLGLFAFILGHHLYNVYLDTYNNAMRGFLPREPAKDCYRVHILGFAIGPCKERE